MGFDVDYDISMAAQPEDTPVWTMLAVLEKPKGVEK